MNKEVGEPPPQFKMWKQKKIVSLNAFKEFVVKAHSVIIPCFSMACLNRCDTAYYYKAETEEAKASPILVLQRPKIMQMKKAGVQSGFMIETQAWHQEAAVNSEPKVVAVGKRAAEDLDGAVMQYGSELQKGFVEEAGPNFAALKGLITHAAGIETPGPDKISCYVETVAVGDDAKNRAAGIASEDEIDAPSLEIKEDIAFSTHSINPSFPFHSNFTWHENVEDPLVMNGFKKNLRAVIAEDVDRVLIDVLEDQIGSQQGSLESEAVMRDSKPDSMEDNFVEELYAAAQPERRFPTDFAVQNHRKIPEEIGVQFEERTQISDGSMQAVVDSVRGELRGKSAFDRVGIEAHRAEKHENARNLNWSMIQNGQEDQSNSADNEILNAKDAISKLHIPIAKGLESEDVPSREISRNSNFIMLSRSKAGETDQGEGFEAGIIYEDPECADEEAIAAYKTSGRDSLMNIESGNHTDSKMADAFGDSEKESYAATNEDPCNPINAAFKICSTDQAEKDSSTYLQGNLMLCNEALTFKEGCHKADTLVEQIISRETSTGVILNSISNPKQLVSASIPKQPIMLEIEGGNQKNSNQDQLAFANDGCKKENAVRNDQIQGGPKTGYVDQEDVHLMKKCTFHNPYPIPDAHDAVEEAKIKGEPKIQIADQDQNEDAYSKGTNLISNDNGIRFRCSREGRLDDVSNLNTSMEEDLTPLARKREKSDLWDMCYEFADDPDMMQSIMESSNMNLMFTEVVNVFDKIPQAETGEFERRNSYMKRKFPGTYSKNKNIQKNIRKYRKCQRLLTYQPGHDDFG